jgi:hypothetical protein
MGMARDIVKTNGGGTCHARGYRAGFVEWNTTVAPIACSGAPTTSPISGRYGSSLIASSQIVGTNAPIAVFQTAGRGLAPISCTVAVAPTNEPSA